MNKSSEPVITKALSQLAEQNLTGERAEAVRLAVKALLVIRSGLHPSLFQKAQHFDPYPVIAKYVRASNAETLAGLVDDTLRNISPQFVASKEKAVGTAVADLFRGGEVEKTAVSLLKTETIPVVMFMKFLYQQAGGFDEIEQTSSEEGKA
ncbi:MAG: hypothetical protein GY797_30690 [Deltaproteobacteria bacterium]|nr:hypothetical protein [Deltaproteobacteria bacterium]